MAIKVPQNEEISGGEKKESVLPSVGENKGAYTSRNNSKEELLREILTPI